MDLYDLTARIAAGKGEVPEYPRPWPDPNVKGRTTMTRSQVLAVLNRHGHHFTIDD